MQLSQLGMSLVRISLVVEWTDRVNDDFDGKIASGRRLYMACLAAASAIVSGELQAQFFKRWPRSAMYRTIDATTTSQFGVCSVYNRISVLVDDAAENEFHNAVFEFTH